MTLPTFVPPFKQLVSGVASYFEANGIAATVLRGWKERNKSINQGAGGANRVVFMTADETNAGEIVNPRQVGIRQVGGDPDADPPVPPTYQYRPLGDWKRTVLVSIWGVDPTAKEDQGAQDDACYQLFMWTMRAVNSVGFGNAVWGSVKFTKPAERAFGLELLTDLTFQTEMADLPEDLVYPGPKITKDE